jgi:hypothetical protein
VRNRRFSKARERGGRGGRGPRKESGPADYWSRLLQPGEGNEFLEKTACTACGALPARILGRLGPTYLRKCRECGVVYVTPRLSESVREEMLRRPVGHLDSPRNLLFRHLMAERLQNMHREMHALPGTGGMARNAADLLEVSAGWGHFLQLCRPHYRSVDGIEISRDRASFARERFDLDIARADIPRDPWPKTHHLIVAWDYVDRIAYPSLFLKWARGRLVPGGQLVLSAANHDSLYRRLLGTRWFHYDPARRLSYFTPSTLKALLAGAGFTDVKIVTSGRSLLRERLGDLNQVDRTAGIRDRWLETLRIRERIEDERERLALDRGHIVSRAWHSAAWRMVNQLATRGLGDEMRIYARRD